MGIVVVGIDPGLGGAVAAVDDRGRLLGVDDTPVRWRGRRRAYDVEAMRQLLRRHLDRGGDVRAVVEAQQAMPGQGVRSMFSLGYGYGLWRGLLAGMGVPCATVAARTWQRALLDGPPGDPKGRSVRKALSLFPGAAIPRSRHGRADAILLAEYGRRVLSGRLASP